MYNPYADIGKKANNYLMDDYQCFATTHTQEIQLDELVKVCDRLTYFATLLRDFDPDNKENNMTRSEIVEMFNEYLQKISPNNKMLYNVYKRKF
jgi:hypothetical protein